MFHARRAFQDESTFAAITGVDETLIHRIHMMLVAINADCEIDVKAFHQYGKDTAALWVAKYSWYYMPVSLHQLFFHAWESMELSILPISYFTEQSLESCNKSFKYDRTHHTRKDSRLHTIMDQFHRQNDKTDLIIAMRLQRRRNRSVKLDLPEDVLSLLKNEDSA